MLFFLLSHVDFGSSFSGVLTDEFGRVQALWGSFSTQVVYHSGFCICSIHVGFVFIVLLIVVYSIGHNISLTLIYSLIFQLKYSCSSSEDHQFVRGIPVYTITRILDKIISGADGPRLLINGVRRPMPLVRILEVELYPTMLSKARSFGLSDTWIKVS